MAASPNEVGTAALAGTDFMFLEAIEGHDLRVGLVATSAFHPEEELKVVCGGDEICDIFEGSFDGEQKTHHRSPSVGSVSGQRVLGIFVLVLCRCFTVILNPFKPPQLHPGHAPSLLGSLSLS